MGLPAPAGELRPSGDRAAQTSPTAGAPFPGAPGAQAPASPQNVMESIPAGEPPWVPRLDRPRQNPVGGEPKHGPRGQPRGIRAPGASCARVEYNSLAYPPHSPWLASAPFFSPPPARGGRPFPQVSISFLAGSKGDRLTQGSGARGSPPLALAPFVRHCSRGN